MKRREFIAGLGSAAAWPVVAWAQQGERVRRIGVLMPGDENDPAVKSYLSAFTQALADLGWTVGRNVRMELRGAAGDAGSDSVVADIIRAGPLARPIKFGSRERPASAAQRATPCANAVGAVGPAQTATREAVTAPARKWRNVIGVLLSMDIPQQRTPAISPVRMRHFPLAARD